jgi:protein tyrosine phosphatase (PTP) superfamily phosphohydrolase (DUF442 family)
MGAAVFVWKKENGLSDPVDIKNWRRLDERVTTSGQPSETELALLASMGVGTVINLGLHSHELALADEAATVTGLGMHYVHIPVDFANPTEEDFQVFADVMKAAEGQSVHVHCILNARVSAFVFRYVRDVCGSDPAAARTLMDSVWKPGGVWAAFIGDNARQDAAHEFHGE